MEIIKLLGSICAVWLFTTGAGPVQFLKLWLKIDEQTNTKLIPLLVISKLINCDLCTGFWVGLLVYQNFWMACIISVSCEAFGRILNKLGF